MVQSWCKQGVKQELKVFQTEVFAINPSPITNRNCCVGVLLLIDCTLKHLVELKWCKFSYPRILCSSAFFLPEYFFTFLSPFFKWIFQRGWKFGSSNMRVQAAFICFEKELKDFPSQLEWGQFHFGEGLGNEKANLKSVVYPANSTISFFSPV